MTADGMSKTVEVIVVDTDTSFYAYNYFSQDGNYGYVVDVEAETVSSTWISPLMRSALKTSIQMQNLSYPKITATNGSSLLVLH